MEKKLDELDLTAACYGIVREVKYDMAILPWGAIEPHNFHLPYQTDSILSHALAVDAANEAFKKYNVRAMVLPPVDGGSQNPGQHELPFCIHYRYETQKAILKDTVAAIYHQGIKKLLIVNGHGGNSFKNMIRDLYLEFPEVTIASTEWYTIEKASNYFEAEVDDHAGETETSVMLYYHPEKVRMDLMGNGNVIGEFAIDGLNKKVAWVPRHWNKISQDSGVGNPAKASAEKGERFVHAIVKKLSALIDEMSRKNLYE